MKTTCLNPNCDGAQFSRGLCRSCYQLASRLVREGRTTWKELVEKGRAQATSSKTEWLLGKKKEE